MFIYLKINYVEDASSNQSMNQHRYLKVSQSCFTKNFFIAILSIKSILTGKTSKNNFGIYFIGPEGLKC